MTTLSVTPAILVLYGQSVTTQVGGTPQLITATIKTQTVTAEITTSDSELTATETIETAINTTVRLRLARYKGTLYD